MTLAPDSIEQYAYVDASYGVHPDARSHGGMILAIGKNRPAEILWLRKLLHDLGYATPQTRGASQQQTPTTVYQDNISTIFIGNKGMSNKGKTKHMDIRYFFIKEKIDNHDVTLQHLPTDEMLADFLTKPLSGQSHNSLRSRILGTCKH